MVETSPPALLFLIWKLRVSLVEPCPSKETVLDTLPVHVFSVPENLYLYCRTSGFPSGTVAVMMFLIVPCAASATTLS